MLRGHLDVLTSSGIFEGWAYDTDNPADPLLAAITNEAGGEIAYGLAHRYREDLVGAGCGIGWCAFHLRANMPVSQLRKSPIRLVARKTGQIISSVDRPVYSENAEAPTTSVAALTKQDPTVIESIDQLHGCEILFDAFIKTHGVNAFVRAVYIYVLGRPVDEEGLAIYGRLIRQAFLSPYVLIKTLSDSDEFRSRPRLLTPPNMAGFPFRRA